MYFFNSIPNILLPASSKQERETAVINIFLIKTETNMQRGYESR